MRRLARLLVACLVTLVTGVWMAAPASAATLVVDDDGQATAGSCNATTPAFSSIQAAVDAATAGDTIRVCPGVYTENVTVGKTLTLLGAKAGVHGKRRNGTEASESIVQPATTSLATFTLNADSIVLDGFAIRNGSAAVFTSPSFSGYAIRNNVLYGNAIGIYANSSGTLATTITRNNVRDNNAAGAGSGTAIYSDQGFSNARIVNNVITGNASAGINLGSFGGTSPNAHGVEIVANTFDANGSGVVLVDAEDIGIRRNTITDSGGSGIFMSAGFFSGAVVQRIDIVGNTIARSGGSGIRVSTDVDDVVITDNVIRDSTQAGINVTSSAAGAVRVFENRANNNGTDGIFFGASTNGNTINDNIARSNGDFDCEDDSTGSGTAGTANTWIKNEGVTSDPPGLCVP